jgi:cytosol alanyl aminopeptidase
MLPVAQAQPVATDVPGLRLPRDVLPVAYAPTLTIDPDKATFDGVIDIDVRVSKPVSRVWLNARNLSIASASATIPATASAAAASLAARVIPGNDNVIGLQFDASLPAGAVRLTLRYSGVVDEVNPKGVFRQQDRDRWSTFTQFEPLDARLAFPCFDEPDMKATWQLTLRIPEGLRAFGNMPVDATSAPEGGWRNVSFQRTPRLPSYLIAFAVGDFDVVDAGKAGINATPISIITAKGRSAEAAFAAANTGAILAATEKYFGMAYPFPKLDLIGFPKANNFSAMENPGLITYTARSLLARPDEMSPRFQQQFIGITAHEIAHMWFGDYVTMTWWDDLWLNESFASWMATYISQELHPEWGSSGWRIYQRGVAMESDRLPSARRIRQPVAELGDVRASFDGIAYAKGQSILTMFEAWLGPEKFKEGVRRYINKHAWGNATSEDFFAALAAADDAVVPALRGFVERPGVPVLDVALRCSGQPSLEVSQRRFVPAGTPAGAAERWVFPACFEFGDARQGREVCTLVKEARQVVPLPTTTCPAWAIANRSGIGYFLAQLSPALYGALPNAKDVLAASDYGPLLGDLSLLVDSGAVTYAVALPVVGSQAGTSDLRAAQWAVGIANRVQPSLIAPENEAKYAAWIREKFGERAVALGWLPRPGDNADTMRLREGAMALVAVRGADAALGKEAQRLAKLWLADRKAIPASARRSVLSGAARTAGPDGAALFEGLLDVAVTTKDGNERDDVLTALGSFRDPALLERALALALDPRLGPRDSARPLQQALSVPASSQAALAWFARNIGAMSARFPKDYQGYWPAWADAACTDAERTQFVAVFESRAKGLEAGPLTYRNTLERIDACIASTRVQRASLNAFLADLK